MTMLHRIRTALLAALGVLLFAASPALAQVDTTARGMAAQANASLPGVRVQKFELPAALGWNNTLYPLNLTASQNANGEWVGSTGLSVKGLFPGYASWPTYYVNVGTGNNANDCLSSGAPCKSLYQPLVKAAAASQTQIYVKVQCGNTVEFDRNNTFTLGGVVTSIQNISALYEAVGGRCRAGAIQPALTWTASGDGFTAPLATPVARMFDKLARDRFGNLVEFTKQPTASAALTGMDAWNQASSVVSLRRKDGQTPSAANTLILVGSRNIYIDGATQISFGLTGATSADGFDLEGGDSGAFRVNFTGGAGGPNVVIALENCTLRYSGNAGTTGMIGDYAVEGVNGLSYVNNCTAGAGATDAWNQHNALGATSYVLWNNVAAYDTGKQSSYISNNLITVHDTNTTAAILCPRGSFSRGVSGHMIGATKGWVGCADLHGSIGDRMNTDAANGNAVGGNYPTEFKLQDTAEWWIDQGNLKSDDSNGYGIVVVGSAKLHLRNTPVLGTTVIQGSATVDTY
jgi:hypothetical protein